MRRVRRPRWDRTPPRRAVALTALTLLAACLALYGIERESITLDESISLAIAGASSSDFMTVAGGHEINQSLYYLLLRGWIGFGSSEATIRILSAIFAIATVPALFFLAERLLGFRTAVAAGLLLATNAFGVWHAQDARGYALAMFLATSSTGALVLMLDRPTLRTWVAYAVLGIAGLYAHFFVGLVLAAHLIAVAVHPFGRRRLRSVLAADVAIGAAAVPILVAIRSTGGQPLAWLHSPSIQDIAVAGALLIGAPRTSGGSTAPIAVGITAVVGALVVIGAVLTARSLLRSWPSAWGGVLVGCWLLVPPVVTLVVSLVTPVFYPRFLIVVVPAIALLAALPLGRLRSPQMFAAAMIGISALGTTGIALQAAGLTKEDWRSATQAVLSRSTGSDGIVFVSPAVVAPFAYYAMRDGDRDRVPTLIYPALDWNRPLPIGTSQQGLESAIEAAPPRFARVWLVVSHDSANQDALASTLLGNHYGVRGHASFEAIDVWEYALADESSGSPENHAPPVVSLDVRTCICTVSGEGTDVDRERPEWPIARSCEHVALVGRSVARSGRRPSGRRPFDSIGRRHGAWVASVSWPGTAG